jgi:hypothetical protein
MRTLYLRNVPDDVVERIEQLAAREGLSVSAYAARELGVVSRRADNLAILRSLPDLEVPIDDIVHSIDVGRDQR